ncbi:unnamed protein product [Rotaria socialis]|uniref:Uncharacterized protein n=1 Tax=Rotaria socialis TaxID=392032 RepID=A0A820IGD8_9BILA|nr:unnamed protein product [Rotaria socialis]CAF3346497.1 unnamed protein product [Rotaria socialis]CAF4263225.1 unnamed protein product [Rotaria socialis]CAF4310709.1 unnamed protein product [Rotaria socialis]
MRKQYRDFIVDTTIILLSIIHFISTFKCSLYAIDQASLEAKLTKINNSSSYNPILNLGDLVFSGSATSTKLTNKTYLSTYRTFDRLGVPHFFLLIIDIDLKSVKLNLTLSEKDGSGSFWQIATVNTNEIIGIRESVHPESTLEVAKINQTDGHMTTIGTYLYGSYSLVMVYASKRRLYFNVIESTLYAVNVDTGKLDINIQIPNDYIIYAIDYDYINDRLIGLVYSSSITNSWILTEIIITTKNELKFDRIGKTIIPFDKYRWKTTYTINLSQRSWITIWNMKDLNKSVFIVLNIDSGEVTEKWETNLNRLTNLVFFD